MPQQLKKNALSYNALGVIYQSGWGVDKDFDKAFRYFKTSSYLGYKDAFRNLGYLYLNGLGVKKNYKEALKLLAEFDNNDKYMLKIISKLNNGSEIITINNISELKNYKNLNDDTIIIIKSDLSEAYDDYYDYKTLKKIQENINKFLKSIDLKQKQEYVFLQIYNKLILTLSFDYKACNKVDNKKYTDYVKTTSRNLVGLINKKCVCCGFSEILKNILSCVNIKAKCLGSHNHEFNKVLLHKKWYYCDLTTDTNKKQAKYCLLCKEEFMDDATRTPINDTSDEYENSRKSFIFKIKN